MQNARLDPIISFKMQDLTPLSLFSGCAIHLVDNIDASFGHNNVLGHKLAIDLAQ
jgi:hypothetical protein